MVDLKPKNTIYISNLNEKIKQTNLQNALKAVFSQCGEIVDIISSKNLKMRGQAFVVFKEITSACQALKSMNGFPFFDKPMRIQFARTESDCIAKLKGTYIERPKKPKIVRQKKKKKSSNDQVLSSTTLQSTLPMQPDLLPCVVPGTMVSTLAPTVLPVPSPTFPAVSNMPLPLEQPNSILFVTNLPMGTNNLILETLFKQFPDFKEVRLVPGRHDIAFVEFANESFASLAKTSLQGFQILPNHAINIMFANK